MIGVRSSRVWVRSMTSTDPSERAVASCCSKDIDISFGTTCVRMVAWSEGARSGRLMRSGRGDRVQDADLFTEGVGHAASVPWRRLQDRGAQDRIYDHREDQGHDRL